jgi:hypothetical protein
MSGSLNRNSWRAHANSSSTPAPMSPQVRALAQPHEAACVRPTTPTAGTNITPPTTSVRPVRVARGEAGTSHTASTSVSSASAALNQKKTPPMMKPMPAPIE